MRLCIYGAGSVGGLIGGLLARSGHEVSLVARGPHLKALKESGCTVETAGDRFAKRDRFTVKPVCTDNPAELGPQDYVVIAVKAPSLPEVARNIAPLIGDHTTIVTAMNGLPWWFFDGFPAEGPTISLPGLDPDGSISTAIATERVIGCVVHIAALVPQPGVIRLAAENRLILGAAAPGLDDKVQLLADAFTPTPLDVTVTGNLRQEIWIKLLGNFNFGPISALTGATTRTIGTNPQLQKLCIEMFDEAEAAGLSLGLDAGMSAMDRIDLGIRLGDFKTSMLQDFEIGRSPEIESIVACVVDIGEALGLDMPVSRTVLRLARHRAVELGLLPG